MNWMSSFNGSLLSKFPLLSSESQFKLKDLYSLNLQANSSVEEVIKGFNRCGSEYEGLSIKVDNCLQVLGVDDKEDFSSETHKAMQDIGAIITSGNIGDGTDIAAVSCLATGVLVKATQARQKSSLVKDIKTIHRKNTRLRETFTYYEKEVKMANEEVFHLQSVLDTAVDDVRAVQVEFSKLTENITATRHELEKLGVTSTISSQTILDMYQLFMNLDSDIKLLQGKLKKYGELPPSIAESSKIVANTKIHLASVVTDLKSKLTAVYSRGR